MKNLIYAALGSSLLFSCVKEQSPKANLSIPSSYDSTGYAANSTVENGVKNNLKALIDKIKTGRTTGVVITSAELNALYTNGSPSVKSITTPYYDGLMSGYLTNLAAATGTIYTPSATINGQGGTYDGALGSTYLFDEYGIEPEQLVEKGLFCSALYNHFLTLAKNPTNASVVDKMIAIYGSSPLFSNSVKTGVGFVPEVNVALYAARRTDQNDANGIYFGIKNNLIKLKAALIAGSNFNKERDDAIAEIKINWEKAILATVVNYCKDGVTKLSSPNVTSVNMSKALHSLSEAVGFIQGLKTIPQADKKITDAQIDEILILLEAKSGENAAFYKFITQTNSKLNDLGSIQSKIQSIYGFTAAEMTNFGFNYIETQSRK